MIGRARTSLAGLLIEAACVGVGVGWPMVELPDWACPAGGASLANTRSTIPSPHPPGETHK